MIQNLNIYELDIYSSSYIYFNFIFHLAPYC